MQNSQLPKKQTSAGSLLRPPICPIGESLGRFRRHLLGLGDDDVDLAAHQEGLFRQVVMLAFEDFLEALHDGRNNSHCGSNIRWPRVPMV